MDEATRLHMTERPALSPTRPHRPGVLLRLDPPTVGFCRYLYEEIGGPPVLRARSEWSREALEELLADPAVDVFVLYLGGVPSGFFELDRRVEGEIELSCFGLLPDLVDRGYGRHLLALAVDAAWDHEPDRLWVRSSVLAEPRILLLGQWAGFEPYGAADRKDDGG